MTFTPGDLLRHASDKARGRARDLLGEVSHREQVGDTFRARVQGSRRAPYRVQINFQTGAVLCSCPDEFNEVCKHACATLLVLQRDPASFLPGPAPRRLPKLDRWNDADIERLLEQLHDLYPEITADWARQLTQDEEDEWA